MPVFFLVVANTPGYCILDSLVLRECAVHFSSSAPLIQNSSLVYRQVDSWVEKFLCKSRNLHATAYGQGVGDAKFAMAKAPGPRSFPS